MGTGWGNWCWTGCGSARGARELGAGGQGSRGAEERTSLSAAPLDFHIAAQFMQSVALALDIPVTRDEPLARHTTFHIGGPADLFAAVTTVEQLEKLAELAVEHGIPATILGGGSNVLVSDAGVRGLVIANQTRQWVSGIGDSVLDQSPYSIPNPQSPISHPRLVADSGIALAGLARTAIKAGWSGLEWAVSVPGTVGGALMGNAGAHGGDIASVLAWALVAYPGQGRQVLTGQQMAFAYRSSLLKRQLGDR